MTAQGSGWWGGNGRAAGLPAGAVLVTLVAVMVGLMKYVFISVNDLVALHSVTPRGATFNPLWLTRRDHRGCNGFTRARSLSPAGLLPAVEFLSPSPKGLKCGVPCAGSLSLGRSPQS